ncbi:oxidoreductase [Agrobacterium vitis]|uniref:VOC family protein n=1 Tax=Agrobacterium vitis TaxID=373 RepID=A0AAE4WZS4_AGRVI|nr:VOC family protein [Agrobacterium vitis]MBF2714125.1 VOC family protein [Agrobacterium vitis]MUO81504.1 oxidoreductase [Agrobacterium vitis]MUO95849.1 oxidoreductase [Agrobacterium vitis]MVA93928.1 oxidoreductase [Agrobacterium vitis]MVB03565.1 oxidoreductase [Agrobacterium vitis]
MTSLIRQIGILTFSSSDIDTVANDLQQTIGLRRRACGDNTVQLSSNARECEINYVTAKETGVVSIGLEATDAAAVDEIMQRLRSEDLEVVRDDSTVPGVERSVTFRTGFGPVFEVHTPVARINGQLHRYNPCRIARLDHCTTRTNDPQGFHDLVTRMLGLRLSDRTENFSNAWYRGADGYHHLLAAGIGSGLHHYGFAARSVIDIADLADTLAAKGRRLLWGPGRHGAGNNIFSYYRDPLGCIVEVSTSMEHIDVDDFREPGIWSDNDKQDLMDLWGSTAPDGFGTKTLPYVVN